MASEISLGNLSIGDEDDDTLPYENHIMSELLVDVLSVMVYSDSLEECKYCRVYGTVIVNDSLSTEVCALYNRHKNNCETISVDKRDLTLEHKYSRIGQMKAPVIHVCLKDEMNDSIVVQGSHKLDNSPLGTTYFEDFRYEVMQNEGGGYVIVKYVALRYGAYAEVDVQLTTRGKTSAEHVTLDVFGSINGHFGKAYKSNIPEYERRALYNTLFHKLEHESQCLAFGSAIPLCRKILIVPSYSSLVIRLDLKERGTQKEIAVGYLEFESMARNRLRWKNTERRGFGDVFVEVSVKWHDIFSLRYSVKDERNYIGSFDSVPDAVRTLFGFQYVEIFSILIGHDFHDTLCIHGEIYAEASGILSLFLRDKKEQPLDIKDNLVPLSGSNNSLLMGDSYYVHLFIEDVMGRVIVNGGIKAPVGMARREEGWFDRRFCSVIKGVGGFVAVHYMVHKFALRALVNVKLISADLSPVTLHGYIVTSYSHQAYDTAYEKEYYRAYLFKKSEADAIDISPNFNLPLSTYAVSVPLDSSLIVEVEMSASVNSSNETIVGTLKFGIGKGEDLSLRINGNSYALDFSVAWSSY